MSRSGEGSFVNVHVGNGLESQSHSAKSFTMSRISMSPGRWTVRAKVELEPASYIKFPVFTTTTEIEVAEQYPHVDKILKNYHTDLYTLWTKAENYAEQEKTTHKAREFGAEIYLKKDGSHEAKEVEPGDPVPLDLNNKNLSASISFTSHLYDSRRAPATTRDIMIAVLHTHFPRKWAIPLESGKAGSIYVGPSGGDKNSPVPGLLIDYESAEIVPPGHEFTAPKKIYQDGPTSRRIALP